MPVRERVKRLLLTSFCVLLVVQGAIWLLAKADFFSGYTLLEDHLLFWVLGLLNGALIWATAYLLNRLQPELDEPSKLSSSASTSAPAPSGEHHDSQARSRPAGTPDGSG